jgi:hypothetical protein
MVNFKLTLSDVLKKDLRIVLFLGGSWLVGLLAVYLTQDEKLLGLVPITNYVAYRLIEELKNEGYVRVLKND